MKVIHVNFSGSKGGAAIAAQRINFALTKNGVDSVLWCARDVDLDSPQECIKSTFFKKIDGLKNILVQFFLSLLKLKNRSVGLFPSNLVNKLNRSDADIINLHWINGEMVSIEQLSKIKKPVVWTLHDMWAFCGAEHCSAGDRYITGYKANDVRSNFANVFVDCKRWNDIDRWIFNRKKRSWKNWNPYIVTPSKWLSECVKNSVLFGHLPIYTIPNCLNLDVFKPLSRSLSKQFFGISEDKRVILCGADSVYNFGKGGDLLFDALNKLENKNLYQIVLFGKASFEISGEFSVVKVGTIKKQKEMSLLYNAVDVVCVPSRMESFGQIASEPISCGVPVVAFNHTGIKDVVVHKKTGYLAEPFNCFDFKNGIDWVFENLESDGIDIKKNSRQYAELKFSESAISKQYISIYKEILNNH